MIIIQFTIFIYIYIFTFIIIKKINLNNFKKIYLLNYFNYLDLT